MCSDLLAENTSRAAAFNTDCRNGLEHHQHHFSTDFQEEADVNPVWLQLFIL